MPSASGPDHHGLCRQRGPQHVAASFKMMTGINMLHVPVSRHTPAVTDLLAAGADGFRRHAYVDRGTSGPASFGHGGNYCGTSRHIARISDGSRVSCQATRQADGIGLACLATRPPDHRQAQRGINAGLADPKIKTGGRRLGGRILAGSPAEFGRALHSVGRRDKWASRGN